MFLERNVDNEAGKVEIACGLPSPGFSERTGTVAELLIQPIEEGQTELLFDEEKTQVLANDGLGTNVLRAMTGGSYRFVQSNSARFPFLLFSPSHPNETRWYNKNAATLVWASRESGLRYRYALTLSPDAPDDLNKRELTENTSAFFSNLTNGTYYFHIIAEREGNIKEHERHRILVDITPPDSPSIKVSQTEIVSGEIIRFELNGNDDLSGLQKNFYVRVDGGVFLPVGSPLFTTFPPGKHTVTVRVFDVAGNFSETSVEIKVHDLNYGAYFMRNLLPFLTP